MLHARSAFLPEIQLSVYSQPRYPKASSETEANNKFVQVAEPLKVPRPLHLGSRPSTLRASTAPWLPDFSDLGV